MHFFLLFSAAGVPTSWCLSLEMGQVGLGAGDQQLSCQAAGRGAASAHRPLSSSLEAMGSCCKCSVVSQSLRALVTVGRLCVAICLPCLGRAGPEDNTKKKNPSMLAPSFSSCGVRQLGRASPGPRARGLLSRRRQLGEGS